MAIAEHGMRASGQRREADTHCAAVSRKPRVESCMSTFETEGKKCPQSCRGMLALVVVLVMIWFCILF